MFPVPTFRHWPVRPCFYNFDRCDAYEKQERTKTKALAAYRRLCAPGPGGLAVPQGGHITLPAGSVTCAAEAKDMITGCKIQQGTNTESIRDSVTSKLQNTSTTFYFHLLV